MNSGIPSLCKRPRCKMLCQPDLEGQSGVELNWSTPESWFRIETVVNKYSSLLSSNNFVPVTLLGDNILRSSEAKFGWALYRKEKRFHWKLWSNSTPESSNYITIRFLFYSGPIRKMIDYVTNHITVIMHSQHIMQFIIKVLLTCMLRTPI